MVLDEGQGRGQVGGKSLETVMHQTRVARLQSLVQWRLALIVLCQERTSPLLFLHPLHHLLQRLLLPCHRPPRHEQEVQRVPPSVVSVLHVTVLLMRSSHEIVRK